MKHNKVNKCQYDLPGLTCQSAVWSKILFCDLLHQTETKGIMTDYDATAAFDRVLHAITLITCHRLGMPKDSCKFIYNLLHNMEFNVITGYYVSHRSFHNNADADNLGQGILQGSSSAALIYNICSDISLNAYHKLATGPPITILIMLNTVTNVPYNMLTAALKDDHTIVTAPQSNTKTWSEMMCLRRQFESG
jgi:hypothetical protein